MAEVTIVGAGLAGLVAAVNCAAAGHQVRVLEKFERIGGDPYIRPAVDVTPMDPERLGRFIGVELDAGYFDISKRRIVDTARTMRGEFKPLADVRRYDDMPIFAGRPNA